MDALISIIMPAYNVGEFIEESIKSVQAQTYNKWELIVVNDGSTDNTPDIVNAMASKDPRITMYNQVNGGVSRARNKALSVAKGEYIAFLDGDDLWGPDFLLELLTSKGNADMVCCGYRRLFKDGTYKRGPNVPSNNLILPLFLKGIDFLHIGSIIVNKTFLDNKNIRFTAGCTIGEDFEFIAKVLAIAQTQSIQKYLMIYRARPGSVMQSKWDWEKRIDSVRARKRIVDYVLQEKNDAVLTTILNEEVTFKTFRFIWKMVKEGYHNEAMELITGEFANVLTRKCELSFGDKLRYVAIMSGNLMLWRWISFVKTKKGLTIAANS